VGIWEGRFEDCVVGSFEGIQGQGVLEEWVCRSESCRCGRFIAPETSAPSLHLKALPREEIVRLTGSRP